MLNEKVALQIEWTLQNTSQGIGPWKLTCEVIEQKLPSGFICTNRGDFSINMEMGLEISVKFKALTIPPLVTGRQAIAFFTTEGAGILYMEGINQVVETINAEYVIRPLKKEITIKEAPECTCSSFDLGRYGCRCKYSEYQKKQRGTYE